VLLNNTMLDLGKILNCSNCAQKVSRTLSIFDKLGRLFYRREDYHLQKKARHTCRNLAHFNPYSRFDVEGLGIQPKHKDIHTYDK